MNDPFATQQAQRGSSREGMDAPDLQVRIAQLKAQQGQALTPKETRRLAVRMGLETEAARMDLAKGKTGDETIYGPRSTSVYEGLRGSAFDPVLAQARVTQARMASDPAYAAEQSRAGKLAELGFPAELSTVPESADLISNELAARQLALSEGISVQEARAEMAPYKPSELADAKAFAPAERPKPAAPVKTTAQTRVAAKAAITPTVNPADYNSYVKNETDRDIATSGRTVSVRTASRMRAENARALAPQDVEVEETDDLTGHTFSRKVAKNARGEVFSVGEPTLKKTNPITEKADSEFIKDYGDWQTKGAVTSAQDLKVLRTLATNLPNMRLSSGFVTGLITKAGLRDYVLPTDSADAAEVVRGIAQRGARAVLGSAYTEKEGNEFMNRAFNPALPPAKNAERLTRMADALEKAAKVNLEKAAYFDKHGTTAGFKPYALADLEREVLGGKTEDGGPTAPVRSAAQANYLSTFK